MLTMIRITSVYTVNILVALLLLTACGGGGGGGGNDTGDTGDAGMSDDVATTPPPPPPPPPPTTDQLLRQVIQRENLSGDPSTGRSVPSINDLLPQLGMKLFFSTSLGGDTDAACVTCHHPVLGGADGLALPIGVGAFDIYVLGPGRRDAADAAPSVSRNSPSVFNVALWDRGLFWDSRIESLLGDAGQNGMAGGISTPDSGFNTADAGLPNGSSLVAAQARFPVTSEAEMRGNTFELGNANTAVRTHLAGRLGNYGAGVGELLTNNWLAEFRTAFADPTGTAVDLITFENIALAIAEYQRSMLFINTPWKAYIDGDDSAISEDAKQGAILFYTGANQGGAGCMRCHSGDFFTDERHHTIGFPQIGAGKGVGVGGTDDFGRSAISGDGDQQYSFRTPTLLNISETAPYGHAGSYATLTEVVRHYVDPRAEVNAFFDATRWCNDAVFQTVASCASLYNRDHSLLAIDKLELEQSLSASFLPVIQLDNTQIAQLVSFLESLTDPCVQDRSCLAPWIPNVIDTGPDGNQLNAKDSTGSFL